MVHELAAWTGITSRTLRRYDRIGLLSPSRVGTNGYRYGPSAVARLQRILLMRRVGLGLPAIGEIVAEEVDEQDALRAHITALEGERDRIEQQIQAVRHALESVRAGIEPCMDLMFEGFNERYQDEVISRSGEQAFRASNDWWHAKSLEQQLARKQSSDDLVAAWIAACVNGGSMWTQHGRSKSDPPPAVMVSR